MRWSWLRLGIVVFWVVMTGWLIRYRAFPEYFTSSLPGYRGLLDRGVLIVDSWMKIELQGVPIGYSHTRVDVDEDDPVDRVRMDYEIVLHLSVLGQSIEIIVMADATLDALYELQRFSAVMTADKYRVDVLGRRSAGNTFKVRLDTGGHSETLSVEIPADVVLHFPMTPISLADLKPGGKLTYKALNPVTMAPENVVIEAVGEEVLEHAGVERPTTVLNVHYQGMDVKAWVDAGGQVLRQETVDGWVLEACTAEEAMALGRGSGADSDLLSAVAVPAVNRISDPRACRRLRVEIRGVNLDAAQLASGRQTVEAQGDRRTRLTVRAVGPSSSAPAAAPDEEGLRPYRQPTPSIQSAHPEFLARAGELAAGRTNSLAVATTIYEWVHRNVNKDPAVSLPSALDVLRRLEGDGNEHAYLFVGLARAAGLPARVDSGLLYRDGAFTYHAWPSVFVGEWLAMDPSIGQPVADATHIALARGELDDPMALGRLVGRMRVEVLEQDY